MYICIFFFFFITFEFVCSVFRIRNSQRLNGINAPTSHHINPKITIKKTNWQLSRGHNDFIHSLIILRLYIYCNKDEHGWNVFKVLHTPTIYTYSKLVTSADRICSYKFLFHFRSIHKYKYSTRTPFIHAFVITLFHESACLCCGQSLLLHRHKCRL